MTTRRLSLGLLIAVVACGGHENAGSVDERPSSGTVVVDGAELRWVREGHGPTLFVLGSSVYYPKAYSQELRNHFEMVFIDGRHFVPSYTPSREVLRQIDLATYAEDVEAVRESLGYGPVTIVGHSIHGQMALEYADRYPENTVRLVLIDAVPFRPPEFAEQADQVWNELASDERKALLAERDATLEAVLADVPPERSWATEYGHRGPLYWADPEYDATELLEGVENGPAMSRVFTGLPSAEAARERLNRLHMPILLVLGRLDFAVPYTAWEELLKGTSGIDYVRLDEDGHNPQTESPDRFDPILIDWMERN